VELREFEKREYGKRDFSAGNPETDTIIRGGCFGYNGYSVEGF
jgi:hypothetical protein